MTTPRKFPPPSGRCRLCGFNQWTGGADTGDWQCGACKTHRFTAPPVRRQRRARNWNRR
jgi:lipopolysaccharide biosynthesis regulator YciM